ncbi:MAG: trypsin-like peptidase domain-containing protein [Planctomycetota bacterium]
MQPSTYGNEPGDPPPGVPELGSPTGGEPPVAVATRAEPSPYAKPNLVLSDPDPYAFANRIRRLVVVFGMLAVLAAGPYLVGQFAYHWRYATQKADYDLAGETLPEAAARMGDFNRLSRSIADRISPAVVSVSRQDPDRQGRTDGQGSGVIVDTDGYVVTNYHVIRGAREVLIRVSDGRITEADIIGADPATDLALLKIDLPNLIAAEWGDSDDVQVGDMVWALGSPFGLPRSLTWGIVSAKERRSSGGVRTASIYQEYMQTDVAINPGNSGGPLVNIEGKIVGINTAIIGDAYAGISFSIPSTFAQQKVDTLRDQGWIERGFLGVTPLPVPDRVRLALALGPSEGVLVAGVEPTGPARQAGIRSGDVILRWNDEPASDPTLLSRKIAATDVGSTALVVVKRLDAGQPRELRLTVRVGSSPLNVRSSDGN